MENPDLPPKDTKEGPFSYDDGAFTVWLSRFGLWNSADKEGKGLCCGLDKESVIRWSREHLNGFQNSYTTYPKKESGYKL